MLNALTVDVEDYFHAEAMAPAIDRGQWDVLPCRVEANVDRLLALFDRHGTRATFFILGWVAQRHPQVVRRITAAGHEVGSHGLSHIRVHQQSPDRFRADVRRTKELLEDLTGTPVAGYRAATFSIDHRTPWAHRILREEAHTYSSSIYPIRHDLYGVPDAPRVPYWPDGADGVVEIPITTAHLLGRRWPVGGGGYFRLFPYALYKRLVRSVHRRDRQPVNFYLHPWEIDPDQPRQKRLSWKSTFRHYLNLGRVEGRLTQLLRDFSWDRMDRVYQAAILGG